MVWGAGALAGCQFSGPGAAAEGPLAGFGDIELDGGWTAGGGGGDGGEDGETVGGLGFGEGEGKYFGGNNGDDEGDGDFLGDKTTTINFWPFSQFPSFPLMK